MLTPNLPTQANTSMLCFLEAVLIGLCALSAVTHNSNTPALSRSRDEIALTMVEQELSFRSKCSTLSANEYKRT